MSVHCAVCAVCSVEKTKSGNVVLCAYELPCNAAVMWTSGHVDCLTLYRPNDGRPRATQATFRYSSIVGSALERAGVIRRSEDVGECEVNAVIRRQRTDEERREGEPTGHLKVDAVFKV